MSELNIDPQGLPPSVIQQSAFEGLFHNALAPDAALAAALKQAGYDLAAPEPHYGGKVFQDCLRLAGRHEYPQEKPEEAERQLGKRFLDGFFRTIVGRMIGAVLPLVGTAGTLKRLPRFYKAGSAGTVVTAEPQGERQWRVTMRDRVMNTAFNLGLLEAALERTGARPMVTIAAQSPFGADYEVRWEPRQ